jgi:hypothetical protein
MVFGVDAAEDGAGGDSEFAGEFSDAVAAGFVEGAGVLPHELAGVGFAVASPPGFVPGRGWGVMGRLGDLVPSLVPL